MCVASQPETVVLPMASMFVWDLVGNNTKYVRAFFYLFAQGCIEANVLRKWLGLKIGNYDTTIRGVGNVAVTIVDGQPVTSFFTRYDTPSWDELTDPDLNTQPQCTRLWGRMRWVDFCCWIGRIYGQMGWLP